VSRQMMHAPPSAAIFVSRESPGFGSGRPTNGKDRV
jgi:hypothetical protein